MEDKRELKQLLEKQNNYAKWQCVLTAAAAVCCLGVFLLVNAVMPQIRTVAGQMEAVLTDLEAITGQLEGQTGAILSDLEGVAGRMDAVLEDLGVVSGELAQADLKGMVEDVDAFVTTGQSAVEQAAEKLNIIDFETLNRAIGNLADVVEPLARFFNVFN